VLQSVSVNKELKLDNQLVSRAF